jgi:hypothetical protein
MWSRLFYLASTAVCLMGLSVAQNAPAGQQPPGTQMPALPKADASNTVDNSFLQKQFGTEYTVDADFPSVAADLDGDGIEDIVIVARVKNPLADEADFDYKVLDPYDNFFGIGDPKITTQFGSSDPARRGLVMCIIHGSGSEAWRSAQPKAKFVIINLPFQRIAAKRIQIRKKKVAAIYAEETGGDQMTSVIYFDGKKYKYQPMGASMQ